MRDRLTGEARRADHEVERQRRVREGEELEVALVERAEATQRERQLGTPSLTRGEVEAERARAGTGRQEEGAAHLIREGGDGGVCAHRSGHRAGQGCAEQAAGELESEMQR